ncbi:MAG: PDZ domain-containing protein [Pseudomonadota bacterium]
MSVVHRYRIEAVNPAAHRYGVRLTIAEPDPDGQAVTMPAWIPGSYKIRDFAKHVISVSAQSAGRSVEIVKTDKQTWQAGRCDGELTIYAEIFAHDDSVRGAHLDLTHAYFNGPCVFFSVVGQEDRTCELEIVPPEHTDDWRVATSMRRKNAEPYGFGVYESADYDELIDHPVEIGPLTIGEFEAAGIPHAIAIRGKTRADMKRLCSDLETLCTWQQGFLGTPDDLDRYLFLLNAPGKGYGGLEHRWSSSNVCSRDHLPRRGEHEVSNSYRTFLGLVSHEYFHLWNVKRLKPAAFTPFDLSAESPTTLLWVFEGITSYYDDLALRRAGLIDDKSYFELIGKTITRVLRTPGRKHQSVADSSFDAWTKFYQPDANSPNRVVSYYAKGSLIALALDLKIRAETGGAHSLDAVMRACWQKWGNGNGGMPETGFEQVCAEVTGLDLQDFFDAAIRGTGELPLQAMLASHGVTQCLRRETSKGDAGGKPAAKSKPDALTLGVRIAERDGRLVFADVENDGPAEAAGVSPGDVAVALDGLALTPGNYDQRLRRYRKGDKLELVVFRGDELLTTQVRLDYGEESTCYLEIDTDADDNAAMLRDLWLNGA